MFTPLLIVTSFNSSLHLFVYRNADFNMSMVVCPFLYFIVIAIVFTRRWCPFDPRDERKMAATNDLIRSFHIDQRYLYRIFSLEPYPRLRSLREEKKQGSVTILHIYWYFSAR